MTRKRFILTIVLSLVLLIAVSAGAQTASDQTFFMTFVPNIQFAPVYVGLEKGYFADAGINLTVEHGDEPVGVDLIASGQRQFGIISGEQVIAARANGRPVVFVYEWFQEYPVGILTTLESGYETMDDLRGQRVGIPGRFGASYTGLIALLDANGMTESDIQLEEIGFNAPDVVCVGAISASVVYVNNEPLQIQHRAESDECGDVSGVQVITVGSAVDMVSNGLVTSEEAIASDPDLVRRFTAAFDRSVRDAIDNPAEAYLFSAEHVENLPLSDELRAGLEAEAAEQSAWLEENPDADRETIAGRRADLLASLSDQFSDDDLIQFEVMMATIDLWDADELGVTTPESWEATQDTLIQMGFIDQPIDLEAAYTNEFVPEGE